MRKEILELLIETENKNEFKLKNNWQEYFESENGGYNITEYIDFPNYKYITQNLEKYKFGPNAVKAELKRMEKDGLLSIEIQDSRRYAERLIDLHGIPEMDGNDKTECIILTTRGKNKWEYFLYKMTENPVALFSLILSIFAVIIAYMSSTAWK